MTLTNQIDYALREMLYLAKSDQLSWTSTRKIADEMQIPATFLSRINMQLVNAGLLESQRGARGGVRLAKDASSITVYDVISAIDGPFMLNKCLKQPEECSFPMAKQYKTYWQTIQECIDSKLKQTSLKELIAIE